MERFENRWSKEIKIVNFLSFFVVFILPYFIIKSGVLTSVKIFALNYIYAIFSLIFFLCWFYSVREYLITNDGLVLIKPFGRKIIRFDEIAEVRKITSKDLERSVRLWGNGGIFGVYGYYRNSSLGKYKAYFADYNNLVLIIKRNGEKIVISPFNSDFFVDYLRKFLKT